MPTLDPINAPAPPIPDITPEADSPQARNARAQEEMAAQARRQADAAAALSAAASVQAAAYAAMAGTTGGEEYARFERILLAIIGSPRDFGAADNTLPGLVEIARALAALAAAEQARLAPAPDVPSP